MCIYDIELRILPSDILQKQEADIISGSVRIRHPSADGDGWHFKEVLVIVVDRETGDRIGGPMDILCVLHNVPEKHFRIVFFDSGLWSKSDALRAEQLDAVEVKMKFLHPKRAKTLAEAMDCLAEMLEWVHLPEINVGTAVIPWDGRLGVQLRLTNWLKAKLPLNSVLSDLTDSINAGSLERVSRGS